jgi:hypothetical protein
MGSDAEPGDPRDRASELVQVERDLRELAESIGAIPPGSQRRSFSRRQARAVFAVVLVALGIAAWLLFSHWQAILVAFAPLVWIARSSRRFRRGQGDGRED